MNEQYIIKNLLSQEAFFILNKAIVRNYGIATAAILASLCEKYTFHSNNGTLYEGAWFYCTREAFEIELGLSGHEQRKALEQLQELQVVEIKRIGTPSKNYYCLHSVKLLEMISQLK